MPGRPWADWERDYKQEQKRREEAIAAKGPARIVDDMEDDVEDFDIYDEQRKPFLYNDADHTIYMGAHGTYHANTTRYYNIPYDNTGALYASDSGDPRAYNEAHDYGGIPKSIMKQIEEHYGISGENQNPENEWTFSKTATMVDWVEGEADAADEMWGQVHSNRYPIVYDPQEDRAYIGQYNQHHGHVLELAFGEDDPRAARWEQNSPYIFGFYVPNDSPPSPIGWFTSRPDWRDGAGVEAVEQAIYEKTGWPHPGQQQEDWTLAKVAMKPSDQRQRWLDSWAKYHEGEQKSWQEKKDVEHVPLEHLKPYMEWDRDLSGQYEQDLKAHIAEHGISEPIYLDFNQDTGHGHISEGNHRLKIAEELGIEHVPVIGYRSMRTPREGKWPGHPLPQTPTPDQHGYVPQTVKPSELGLPVKSFSNDITSRKATDNDNGLNKPDWEFSSQVKRKLPKNKTAKEPWVQDGIKILEEPDDLGEGWGTRPFIHQNGTIFMGQPGQYHMDLVEKHGLHGQPREHGWLEMSDQGQPQEIGWYDVPSNGIEVENALQKAYGFTVEDVGEEDWRLGSANNDLQWEPGQEGKGWVIEDGSVWTWPIDPETRMPWHMNMHGRMKAKGLNPLRFRDEGGYVRSTGSFEIDEQGGVHRLGKPVDQKFLDLIAKADPRLHAPDAEDWTL